MYTHPITSRILPIVILALLASTACKKDKIITPADTRVADFTYSGPICVDSNIIFVADASLDGMALTWNFGDGSTATEHKPMHRYKDTGSYNITLSVSTDPARTKQKTVTLLNCSPYTQTVCRNWNCDKTHYSRNEDYTDTVIYTQNEAIQITYAGPGTVNILGDKLYYDRHQSDNAVVVFTIKSTYEERTLYYYPAGDSIKYHTFSRTGFVAYTWSTLVSK